MGMSFLALPEPLHPNTLRQIALHDYDISASSPELYRAGLDALPTGDLSDFVVLLENAGSSTGIMGTDLPLVPPDPSAFSTAQVEIKSAGGSEIIAAILTLPEPTSAATTVAAALGLGCLARRRRSRTV